MKTTEVTTKLQTLEKCLKKTEKERNTLKLVTHESQIPILRIQKYCRFLLQGELIEKLSPKQLDFVKRINSESILLEKWIGDVLDKQRLEMNTDSSSRYYTVKELIDDAINDNQSITNTKKIQIINCVDDDSKIFVEKNTMLYVLEHLIKNAAEAVPYDGKIQIGVNTKNQHIVFYIKDNGEGIQKEKQKYLFTKFFQTQTNHGTKHGGDGLGLYLCKNIVESLGGKIWFESEEKLGSTFYFSLPKDKQKLKLKLKST